jgi:hypothetical protein
VSDTTGCLVHSKDFLDVYGPVEDLGGVQCVPGLPVDIVGAVETIACNSCEFTQAALFRKDKVHLQTYVDIPHAVLFL